MKMLHDGVFKQSEKRMKLFFNGFLESKKKEKNSSIFFLPLLGERGRNEVADEENERPVRINGSSVFYV